MPEPVRDLSVRLLTVVLACACAGLLGGCGDPVVGGAGELVEGAAGAPDVLVVEGSPYQMGWWQGKLLADRIAGLHERWQDTVIRAQVGLAYDTRKGAAGDIRETVELYADQTAGALPERVRQELEGIADGSGVPFETLLFSAVMRDGLRIWLKKMEPRLPGALAAVISGPEARGWWVGPDVDVLADEWVVIHRKPLTGPSSVVLTWPGSTGGIAGLASSGLGFLFCEASVEGEMRGFGGGIPYPIGARVAMESADTLDRMRAQISGTAGHAVIGLFLPPDESASDDEVAPFPQMVGSIEVYRGVQDELRLGKGRRRAPFIVLGPWQSVWEGRKRAKIPRGATGNAVFDKARGLVETKDARGPRCVFRRVDGGWMFAVKSKPGDAMRSFRLDPNGLSATE